MCTQTAAQSSNFSAVRLLASVRGKLPINTDARSAELAQAPVLHGGSTRGNGHRSALRGTSGNAQCSASRPQVIKPSPRSYPLASLRVVGVGSLPRCDAALRVVGVGRCRASCCRRGFTHAAMLPTLCSTRTFDVKLSPNESSGLRACSPLRKHANNHQQAWVPHQRPHAVHLDGGGKEERAKRARTGGLSDAVGRAPAWPLSRRPRSPR